MDVLDCTEKDLAGLGTLPFQTYDDHKTRKPPRAILFTIYYSQVFAFLPRFVHRSVA